MRFESLFAACFVLASCAGGGHGQSPKDPLSQASVEIRELPSDRVATEIRELLVRAEPTGERLNRLASVVKAQLTRARGHFERGDGEEGIQATMGALYLVRSVEYRTELFEGSADAILHAAAHVARLGDEGRALAFYEIANEILQPSSARDQVQEHLAALHSWQQSASQTGTMQQASARQRSAVHHSLVICNRQNLQAVTKTSLDWLNRAIVEGRRDKTPTTFFEHDERMEARRAVLTSALTVAALHIRDGNAGGALDALEIEPIASAASERLISRLQAAQEGVPDAWADLFGLFESAGAAESEALSSAVARGASFGAAVALYRLEPTKLRATIPLSTLLVEHGMSDVAPLILSNVVSKESDEREVAWALRLVFGALTRAERTGDYDMTRRVFANAASLLALASSRPGLDVNAPSVADFHYVMGALETRAGDLERGRPHLARAVALAPSRDALRMLSAIDRQRGDVASALISVQGIQALTQKEGDLVGQARASLLAFELHRDAGRNDDAEAALRPALEQALDARHSARTGTEVAIAETLLAEVLEQYGALDAAERAAERAFDSSQHDLGRLTTALLDASRRALTHGDVATARDVLRRAVDAKLDHDDLVYVALWTRLTEQGAKVTSDGSAVEAVMMLEPETAWTRALRDWGRNSLTGEQLVARAGSAVEKTEAQFYILMSAYASGDASTSVAPLSEVAKSPTIELIEVRIARDLIARANNAPTPQLPSGIELP